MLSFNKYLKNMFSTKCQTTNRMNQGYWGMGCSNCVIFGPKHGHAEPWITENQRWKQEEWRSQSTSLCFMSSWLLSVFSSRSRMSKQVSSACVCPSHSDFLCATIISICFMSSCSSASQDVKNPLQAPTDQHHLCPRGSHLSQIKLSQPKPSCRSETLEQQSQAVCALALMLSHPAPSRLLTLYTILLSSSEEPKAEVTWNTDGCFTSGFPSEVSTTTNHTVGIF